MRDGAHTSRAWGCRWSWLGALTRASSPSAAPAASPTSSRICRSGIFAHHLHAAPSMVNKGHWAAGGASFAICRLEYEHHSTEIDRSGLHRFLILLAGLCRSSGSHRSQRSTTPWRSGATTSPAARPCTTASGSAGMSTASGPASLRACSASPRRPLPRAAVSRSSLRVCTHCHVVWLPDAESIEAKT